MILGRDVEHDNQDTVPCSRMTILAGLMGVWGGGVICCFFLFVFFCCCFLFWFLFCFCFFIINVF